LSDSDLIENITKADSVHSELFLQSSMWGDFKARFGWKQRCFQIKWTNLGSTTLLTLSRKIAPGITMAYIPWGPQLPDGFPGDDNNRALAQLAKKLKPFFAANTAFVRFDPPWYTEDSIEKPCGLRRAAASVQPSDTVIVNLQSSCEELLAAMKSKWRYNISLAQKKGVQIQTGGVQNIETFYSLLCETAARDGIAIHHIGYYKTLFEVCAENNVELRLYTASHEGDVLAAIMVLFYGKWATYLYGASSSKKRNLMPSYALQWKAMQDAKIQGCLYYDLFGIPPSDDPGHPMAGLYLFKTGFGGTIIHRPGSWDFVYKPLIYRLFTTAEAIRKKIRDRKKGR
jgi:lipid II:glycine glycyltransferase (peptidoglycan interpeptide bridge formation enzyme)